MSFHYKYIKKSLETFGLTEMKVDKVYPPMEYTESREKKGLLPDKSEKSISIKNKSSNFNNGRYTGSANCKKPQITLEQFFDYTPIKNSEVTFRNILLYSHYPSADAFIENIQGFEALLYENGIKTSIINDLFSLFDDIESIAQENTVYWSMYWSFTRKLSDFFDEKVESRLSESADLSDPITFFSNPSDIEVILRDIELSDAQKHNIILSFRRFVNNFRDDYGDFVEEFELVTDKLRTLDDEIARFSDELTKFMKAHPEVAELIHFDFCSDFDILLLKRFSASQLLIKALLSTKPAQTFFSIVKTAQAGLSDPSLPPKRRKKYLRELELCYEEKPSLMDQLGYHPDDIDGFAHGPTADASMITEVNSVEHYITYLEQIIEKRSRGPIKTFVRKKKDDFHDFIHMKTKNIKRFDGKKRL